MTSGSGIRSMLMMLTHVVDRVVAKFHSLSEALADQGLRSKPITAVQELDARPKRGLSEKAA